MVYTCFLKAILTVKPTYSFIRVQKLGWSYMEIFFQTALRLESHQLDTCGSELIHTHWNMCCMCFSLFKMIISPMMRYSHIKGFDFLHLLLLKTDLSGSVNLCFLHVLGYALSTATGQKSHFGLTPGHNLFISLFFLPFMIFFINPHDLHPVQ